MKFSHLDWQWAKDHLTKPKHQAWKTFLSCWWGLQATPEHYCILQWPWVISRGGSQVPTAEDTMHTRHRAQRPRAGADLNGWPLPEDCSLGTRRHQASFQRREAINQLWCLWATLTTNLAQPWGYKRGTLILVVTNSSLIGLRTHSTGEKQCLVSKT